MLNILPVTRFKDPKAMILTLKMLPGSHREGSSEEGRVSVSIFKISK
jgi:hypothetical protein